MTDQLTTQAVKDTAQVILSNEHVARPESPFDLRDRVVNLLVRRGLTSQEQLLKLTGTPDDHWIIISKACQEEWDEAQKPKPIVFNPKAEYLFCFEVDYANGSMTGSALEYKNAQACQAAAVDEAIRLAGLGYKVTEVRIEAACLGCDGKGHNLVRQGKRVTRWIEKRCPMCKGKHSTVRLV